MPYINLGSTLPNVAVLDQTGQNRGNLTNHLTASVINTFIANFECYHMVVTNVPGGAAAEILIGTRPYSFTFPFSGTEWDPQQPMLLNPGQDVYFLWSALASVKPAPIVTMYLRYDPTLPGNSYNPGGA